MTARVRDFNEFLRDHVNLNQSRVESLQKRVSSLDDFISERSSLTDMVNGDIIPQGSFAHRTIIKPYSGNDFDADVLLPLEEQPDWTPKKYILELNRALGASSNYAGKTVLGKRCVTIDYANDFHIDVVPFVTRSDGLTYITHRIDNEFVRQDPVAFTDWIRESARTTNGHLIRVVRLVKYLRDRSSIEVPSVVIAALLTERVRIFSVHGEYSNVASTLTALLEDLNDYIGPLQSPPFINDRIGGNIADRVTQTGFKNLQSQVSTWARKARQALDAKSEESVEEWQKLFGTAFGNARVSNAIDESVVAAANTPHIETYEYTMAPGEQTLEGSHGIETRIDPNYHMRLVGRFSPRSTPKGRPRPMDSNGGFVPIGRELVFTVEECNVPGDYDIYWKVRNAGPEAARLQNFRGEIRKAGATITENSMFYGPHWVEAWAVKRGVAVATARQDVTIMQN
ncbi:SMODS domain-containing nucleotidyltransferase [Brevibacterium oceani]|uniref:SMODS domain-containing nucleotidyltransferase n=1 Tax=Brevibacterium oceani TaxID=358099 RepID=UPI001B339B86|nr:nucleotidyltransferase [Brevibacterium oceani]